MSEREESPCTRESHEALKNDPIAWASYRLLGVTREIIDEQGRIYDLEQRNCPFCGSTLGMELYL